MVKFKLVGRLAAQQADPLLLEPGTLADFPFQSESLARRESWKHAETCGDWVVTLDTHRVMAVFF